jgi:hypothetical protein
LSGRETHRSRPLWFRGLLDGRRCSAKGRLSVGNRSWDIVTQQDRGTIAIHSRLGEFTEFTVRLPRAVNATSTAIS